MENNDTRMGGLATVEVMRTHEDAIYPTRAHEDDAGLDLYSLFDSRLDFSEGKTLRTGIALAIPKGYVGIITDRSSLAKRGLKIAGGIIDSGYRGEVHIIVWNICGGNGTVNICKGDRIAQIMIVPISTPRIVETLVLPASARGTNGFGSSGR
jgi:dUTP pyrophosphatase